MKIEHIAIWCKDLESMRTFYQQLFHAISNNKYQNPQTGFSSYFLTFPHGDTRLELMQMPNIAPNQNTVNPQCMGLIHFSIQVGSREAVNEMTQKLIDHNCTILRGPRTTGDGYYELEALDIEGNRLEIMA